jgi:hypothetical protein
MQVIQHTELGSAQSSITFSSIPQTYTDLLLVVSGRNSDTLNGIVTQLNIQFNSVGSGYSDRPLEGSGSSVGSGSRTSQSVIRATALPNSASTSNTFGNVQIYIPNYTSSANKSVSIDGVSENNATQSFQTIVAGLWANSAAITSINLSAQVGGNFVSGSSATLYGILKGSSGGVTVS